MFCLFGLAIISSCNYNLRDYFMAATSFLRAVAVRATTLIWRCGASHCHFGVIRCKIISPRRKTKTFSLLYIYSTDQKKPSREWERERKRYRMDMRMGTEWIRNGYRTVTEKAFSRMQTWNNDPWGIFCRQKTARNERGCSDIPH